MIAERELNSLYYDKWRKLSKSRRDLDLDQTRSSIELCPGYFNILQLIKPQLQKMVLFILDNVFQ